MKRIDVEVELTNGERHTLKSKFSKKSEDDLKDFFNININKEILSLLLDRIKESLLETDITIENLKSIHFSVYGTEEEKTKVKFPSWFNYKVISFRADSLEEMNKKLIERHLDASDIISITHDYSHDYWYEVLCKRKL